MRPFYPFWLALVFAIGASGICRAEDSASWNKYLAQVEKESATHALQRDCAPRKLPADPSIARQGAVLLAHGMTACPQQFFELAPYLQKRGYDVYLFLMPGHGRLKSPKHTVFDDMPAHKDWKRYLDLAKLMNDVAKETSGQRIIGGLSVGGAVAMASLSMDPKLYDRALLFAPYLQASNKSAVRLAIPTVRAIPGLPRARGHWKYDCGNPERAGYCDYYLDQILANEDLGKWVTQNLTVSGRTQIQYVGVMKDASANNTRTLEVLKRSGFKFSGCRIPGAHHPFFVRLDNLGDPMPWMPDFLNYIPSFTASGATWPTRDLPSDAGFPQCQLGYEPAKAK